MGAAIGLWVARALALPDRISVPTRKGACGGGFHDGCSAGTKR